MTRLFDRDFSLLPPLQDGSANAEGVNGPTIRQARGVVLPVTAVSSGTVSSFLSQAMSSEKPSSSVTISISLFTPLFGTGLQLVDLTFEFAENLGLASLGVADQAALVLTDSDMSATSCSS
jgi:hypothetical protein